MQERRDSFAIDASQPDVIQWLRSEIDVDRASTAPVKAGLWRADQLSGSRLVLSAAAWLVSRAIEMKVFCLLYLSKFIGLHRKGR